MRLANTAEPGKKFNQLLVGFSVHWRGGNADFQTFSIGSVDPGLSGTGLDAQTEDQGISIPAKPA